MKESIRVVADITRVHAARRPDHVATVFAGEQTTYAQLDRHANQIANALIAEVGSGGRIAVLAANTAAFFELFFGAAKANCVLVPVNPRLAPMEVCHIVNDARAELLFVGASVVDTIRHVRADLNTVKRIVALSGATSEREPYCDWRDRQDTADPAADVDPFAVVLQVYTSGTTGHPKGVQLTNHNLVSVLPDTLRRHGNWNETDVNLVCLPLSHVGGSVWGLAGYYVGAANAIVAEAIPDAILRAISEHRVTKLFVVPALLRFMLLSPAIDTTDLSSVSLLVYGGSPMSVELLGNALTKFKCPFGQLYGLTETSGGITYLPPEDHHPNAGNRLLSCGRPLSQVEIRVVDRNGVDLPVGKIGEILCRTPQLMKGYWELPGETATSIKDGWLHTGDAGYLDGDGYLYIHDRVNDMIVTGGENVYPAEVERVLLSHPSVADAAVVGVPDESWGESVKAFVVRKPQTDATAADIVEFVKEHVAGFKTPKSIEFVEQLPRNAAGKVLRRELRAPSWTNLQRQVN
jgi:acyl-CoA synthetase (AMP-forming)/AMP-acid ligase II